MRRILLATVLFPSCAFADQITATSRVTDVTIYAYGAQITRQVTFDAPAGTHDVTIADLPQETYAEALRIAPGTGGQIASFALQPDFVPPSQPRENEALRAAEAEVQRLEADERSALLALEGLQTRINAANAQIAFLQGVKVEATIDTTSAASLRDIGKMIGDEVLLAGEVAHTAKADFLQAEATLADIRADLKAARELRGTLSTDQTLYAALDVKVVLEAAGPQTLTITQFVQSASWRPVYDMRLSREGGDRLTLQRGVLISQSTGEDWDDVTLTLSTANPSAQATPTALYPEYRSIGDSKDLYVMQQEPVAEADSLLLHRSSPAVSGAAPAAYTGQAALQGDIVIYSYDAPADVRTGASDLRLALDEIVLTPEITAHAVPRYDVTAFMMASFTNSGAEVLLPGYAYLYREGTLIGGVQMGAIQPGQEAELAFGAIEGLRLTRDMPVRATGERGLILSSNQQEETAVLQVENLTGQVWDVRLLDLTPYSEQEDLEISFVTDVPVTEEDVDGQRGILAWDFPLAAGEKTAVTLTTTLSWPDGMVLQ
ncbi:MAG: hypothetical protein RLZZ437_1693 [Pseudomonadota bacterium]|jgi:uncharacterized protein (TIGR02231 family)